MLATAETVVLLVGLSEWLYSLLRRFSFYLVMLMVGLRSKKLTGRNTNFFHMVGMTGQSSAMGT